MLMKRMIIVVALIVCGRICQGQNFQEWVQQNATQQRYLIEQVAQLKIYLELAEKGYEIARDGLDLISGIKNGEFRLHKDRFDSLAIVKPVIRDVAKANDIVGLVRRTILLYWQLDDILGAAKYLSRKEKAHLRGVFDRLAWETADMLDLRDAVLEDGQLSMTDDARTRMIDKLYFEASENYRFARQVLESAAQLSGQRQHELDETLNSRVLYGINQNP